MDHLVDSGLVVGHHVHILHRTAFEADQVVVVAPQPLGQLVAGEALGSEVWGENARVLQHCKRAVDGRQGEGAIDLVIQLGGREGSGSRGQGGHDAPPSSREASFVFNESLLDFAVERWL